MIHADISSWCLQATPNLLAILITTVTVSVEELHYFSDPDVGGNL